MRSIDLVIERIMRDFADDPEARDAAIRAAIDEMQAGEMFRTPPREAG